MRTLMRSLTNRLKPLIIAVFLFMPMVPLWCQTTSDTNLSAVVGAGARAWGMGGAFIAVADDATAASWNPGGLGQLEKPELSLVFRFQQYRNTTPASALHEDDLRYFMQKGPKDVTGNSYNIDFASITWPIKIGDFKIVPQLSYQRVISFKLDSSSNNSPYLFPSFPMGNRIYQVGGTLMTTEKTTGGPEVISLTLATRLFRRLNIGVTFNSWFNGYEGNYTNHFTYTLFPQDNPSDIVSAGFLTDYFHSKVEIKGFTVNAGILLDVTDKFKIGAVYKSGANVDVEYDVSLQMSGLPGVVPPFNRTLKHKTEAYWPDTWGIGFSYRFIDPLTLSVDFTKTMWSKCILHDTPYRDVVVDIYFPSFQPVVDTPSVKAQDQQDTSQFRIGLEYVLFGKHALFPLRCGFFTDSQYFPDSSGNRVTYQGITAGVGTKWGSLAVDFAIIYEWGSYLRSDRHYYSTQYSETKAYVSTIYSF